MKGTVVRADRDGYVLANFKYIGTYSVANNTNEKLNLGDVIITSNVCGLDNHDEYVNYIRKYESE